MSRKIGALTPCWNEEACIAFTVGSLLPYVDKYVVVDSGSTDKTLQILKSVFAREIKNGKLILIEYGELPDFDISKPKNAAIERLREEGCSHFIRLDGDDVFYDKGAERAIRDAKRVDDKLVLYTINHWELYQSRAQTTSEWLDFIRFDLNGAVWSRHIPRFWCLRMPPGANPTQSGFKDRFNGSYGHARIYRTLGAVSQGKWTDEAWGDGVGEDIRHPGYPRITAGNQDEDIVHYGWARPMEKKLNKGGIWAGKDEDPRIDPRIDRMEKSWEVVDTLNLDRMTYGIKHWPRSVIFPFTKHPEVFERLLPQVAEIIND